MIPQNELSHQDTYFLREILCTDPWSVYMPYTSGAKNISIFIVLGL